MSMAAGVLGVGLYLYGTAVAFCGVPKLLDGEWRAYLTSCGLVFCPALLLVGYALWAEG